MVPSSIMAEAWFIFSRMNKWNRAVISRGRLQKSILCGAAHNGCCRCAPEAPVRKIASDSMGPARTVFVRAAELTVAWTIPTIIASRGTAFRMWRLFRPPPVHFGPALAFQQRRHRIAYFAQSKVLVIMKLSTRLTDAFPTRWLDWKRRDTRDAIVIVGLAIFTFVVGTINDLTLALFQFGIAHADQEADDIIFVVFILGIAMTVFRIPPLSGSLPRNQGAHRRGTRRP